MRCVSAARADDCLAARLQAGFAPARSTRIRVRLRGRDFQSARDQSVFRAVPSIVRQETSRAEALRLLGSLRKIGAMQASKCPSVRVQCNRRSEFVWLAW